MSTPRAKLSGQLVITQILDRILSLSSISRFTLLIFVCFSFISTNAFAGESYDKSNKAEYIFPVLAANPAEIQMEADYIVSSKFTSPGHPADGAINNVCGAPTWIVPRENALAILGLLLAAELLNSPQYKVEAEKVADYLVRVQDSDGGWFDQYSYENPTVFSKSPTQTAEVMMAFQKLGFNESRYQAMKKGADFLLTIQDPANKGGNDDGLIGGGLKEDGTYQTWRWTSDNSFAYLALDAAMSWALEAGDRRLARKYRQASKQVLQGINRYLYVKDKQDSDYGVWRRVIDERGNAVDPSYHEWINYAPQMLDLPARGVGKQVVGEWIHRKFQKEDGAVVWDDGQHTNRKSPGFSFQASLVWLDLGQSQYASAALDWAMNSGLWQTAPDENGCLGGWIDWIENGTQAPFWQRFIDTSFYATAVFNGGYDFNK